MPYCEKQHPETKKVNLTFRLDFLCAQHWTEQHDGKTCQRNSGLSKVRGVTAVCVFASVGIHLTFIYVTHPDINHQSTVHCNPGYNGLQPVRQHVRTMKIARDAVRVLLRPCWRMVWVNSLGGTAGHNRRNHWTWQIAVQAPDRSRRSCLKGWLGFAGGWDGVMWEVIEIHR